MKTKLEDSQGNIIADQRQGLKNWNSITQLYDWGNQPENTEVKTEQEVNTGQKGPYPLHG
jgi:hypothetical protein